MPPLVTIVALILAGGAILTAAPQYVDSRTCASCHRQIAADYARTGMGRSFFRAAVGQTETGEYFHDRSDTYYSMSVRDGQSFQRRWQIGIDGQKTNVEELRVDYVMGSGNHAKSYLHRTPRGTLIELPLGWYSGNGGRLGMSPGSDSAHPLTRRFISYRCMSCHNAIPAIPAGHEAPGRDPVYAGNLPEGIDCQRCHGPGSDHIRATGKQARVATIVNPARLDPQRRMEVCLQCHLETTSGRIPSAVIRFNRGVFSFRPGEPLDAFMIAFDHAPGTGHDGKFEVVGSAYRLRQSPCFLKSAGKLTCESCHNPHRAPRGPEAIAYYAAACRQCHAGVDTLIASRQHPKGPDCAGCHMPKRRPDDTPGLVMTDHLIQRGPPTANLVEEFREQLPSEYAGPVVPYYPAPLPPTPENALYVAVAQVAMKNNLEAGLPVLAREVARQKPASPDFYSVLGDGLLAAGKVNESIAAYTRAVELAPHSVHALRGLAAADQAHAGDWLAKALKMAPEDPITWHRSGELDLAAGRYAEAARKVRQAIALDPYLPGQSRTLAEALHRSGHLDEAQAALADALRTDPSDDAAWNRKARILTEKGEVREALDAFERAIRLSPSQPSYLYDYGLVLARLNRLDEALERVQAALRLDPKLADAHELLGGLFESKGALPDAAREYRRALELRPTSRVHFRLGTVLGAQGDQAGAKEHLEAAETLRRAGR
jgi:predicted CXXCH cytochrome family protein